MRSLLNGVVIAPTIILLCLAWLAIGAEFGAPTNYQMGGGWESANQGPYAVRQQPIMTPSMMPAGSFGMPYGSDGPSWKFAAEAIAMQRTATRNQPLFINNPPDPQVEPFSANDMTFPAQFGMRLSAIRQNVFGSGFSVEAGYFQIENFAAEASVPGSSFMVTDLEGTGFTINDGVARYTSAIYSGEVNLRRECDDWLTLLCGFRMVQLNEHYRGTGADFVTLQTDSLAIDTHNYLYGFQLGAEAEAYSYGPLVLSAYTKAGVLCNTAHQNYASVYSDAPFDTFDADGSQASFLGEAGIVATYAFTNHLSFRMSAEALWLTGVALAPEQIGSVNSRSGNAIANTSGTVFYYGGGMGFEYQF